MSDINDTDFDPETEANAEAGLDAYPDDGLGNIDALIAERGNTAWSTSPAVNTTPPLASTTMAAARWADSTRQVPALGAGNVT